MWNWQSKFLLEERRRGYKIPLNILKRLYTSLIQEVKFFNPKQTESNYYAVAFEALTCFLDIKINDKELLTTLWNLMLILDKRKHEGFITFKNQNIARFDITAHLIEGWLNILAILYQLNFI